MVKMEPPKKYIILTYRQTKNLLIFLKASSKAIVAQYLFTQTAIIKGNARLHKTSLYETRMFVYTRYIIYRFSLCLQSSHVLLLIVSSW